MKIEITQLLNDVNRKGMSELKEYLERSDYFEAPASTRFHSNHKGGLARHSYYVYKLFEEKNKKYGLGLSKECIIICGLLHDVCKVGLYSPKVLKNGDPAKTPYVSEENLPLGHCTKSIFTLSKFIELTEEEALIIRWHMSWSDFEFKKHIDAVRGVAPAITAFICSDLEASAYLEKEEK